MLSSPRPRRTRNDLAKHYDAERKDLGLTEVLGVLEAYADYGGGINCSVCGKLYKSRVCFIKHLWEHTVYWDLFAGDKNHMRVLSIQAALILYGTSGHPELPVSVESLLVTSPNSSEHQAKDPLSPSKEVMSPPKQFGKSDNGYLRTTAEHCPSTPKKVESANGSSSGSSTCPPTPRKIAPKVATFVGKPAFNRTENDVLTPHNAREPPTTPVKKRSLFSSGPPKPGKKNKRRPAACSSVGSLSHSQNQNASSASHSQSVDVGNFFVASPGVTTEDLYWKDGDACPCKRKRSE